MTANNMVKNMDREFDFELLHSRFTEMAIS